MIATHRNNRLVPVVIITLCVWLFYCLVDPSVANLRASQRNRVIEYAPAAASVTRPVSSSANETLQKTYGELSPDDVLLIMRTGGTSLWKRLLIHLTTTLSKERINRDNIVIYSDLPEKIADFTVIDALANVTKATMDRPDFDIYRSQPEYAVNNVYAEAAGLAGDDYGPTGGWIIDKYKFLPIIQHAGANWPHAKWYVFMEDDAYLFLPNLLRHLSTLDWREPHYLGHYSAKSDVVFAHGGAGFALSRGAWDNSFGRNMHMAEEFEEYTADHCCGDQVLGRALNEYGVKFGENGGDEKFTWGFNPNVHWNFGFSRWNWCSPLMSWHKTHARDIARYYDLERSWDFEVCLSLTTECDYKLFMA